MKVKMDKDTIQNLFCYGVSFLIVAYILFGDSFSSNSEIAETPSNGDTRIERESESEYGETGYSIEWEETYYNGEWIPTEEYDSIKDEEYNRAMAYLDYTDVYFIDNGYYYHMDTSCEGLDGYNDLNQVAMIELQDYPNLKPCNWCTDKEN